MGILGGILGGILRGILWGILRGILQGILRGDLPGEHPGVLPRRRGPRRITNNPWPLPPPVIRKKVNRGKKNDFQGVALGDKWGAEQWAG